jgi:hypothetical protein
MANRVLSAGDVLSRPWAKVGDVLLDTPTAPRHADGKVIISYGNMASAFASARLGATIWIDGSIGTFYNIRLSNGFNDSAQTWNVSDENNYVHIRPVPNTRVDIDKNASTHGGYAMLVQHIKFVIATGEDDYYKGIRDGWPSSFLTGKFGFKITGEKYPRDTHMLSVGVPDGGHFIVRGFEIAHGFSAVRFGGVVADHVLRLDIERCYLRDGGTGEGVYAGSTQAPPYAKLRLRMINNIIVRRPCESIQIQHLLSMTGEENAVGNFVVFCSDTEWLKAFQPNQDSVVQWVHATGGNILCNGIIDGGMSVAVNNFGSLYPTVDSDVPSIAENLLVWGIGGIFSYIHNTNVSGVWRWFRDIFIGGATNRYYDDSLNNPQDYYVLRGNLATDKMSWTDIIWDGVKSKFLASPTYPYDEVINVTQGAVEAPQYINSGWHGMVANNIMIWKDTYGNYHDNPIADRGVLYKQGWIVYNSENENGTGNGEHMPYVVLQEHRTLLGSLNPRAHIATYGEVLYKRVTWDTAGVLSTQPSWNPATAQSDVPPDDFRLVADSLYNKLGMGLQHNPQNTHETQIQWFRRATLPVTGEDPLVGAIAIPEGKDIEYTFQEHDAGMYACCGFRPRDENGNFSSSWWLGEWKIVEP